MHYIKSIDDLKADLEEQIQILRSSVMMYDQGFTAAASIMSNSLRLLLKDYKRTKSLLGQLGIKDLLQFHTVVEVFDAEKAIFHSGIGLKLENGKWRFNPNLTEPKQKLVFEAWWTQHIYKGGGGSSIQRGDLILSVAETDGGTHVDPDLRDAYVMLARYNGIGWTNASDTPLQEKVERVFIRQISHEVLQTFDEQLEALLQNI